MPTIIERQPAASYNYKIICMHLDRIVFADDALRDRVGYNGNDVHRVGIRLESGDGYFIGVPYLHNDVGWVQMAVFNLVSIFNNQSGGVSSIFDKQLGGGASNVSYIQQSNGLMIQQYTLKNELEWVCHISAIFCGGREGERHTNQVGELHYSTINWVGERATSVRYDNQKG